MAGRVMGHHGKQLTVKALPGTVVPPVGTEVTVLGYTEVRVGPLIKSAWRDVGRAQVRKATELEGVAKELGISQAQLAVAWCLKNPHVSTVILGATRPEQLSENLEALETAALLTGDVMEKIEEILDNRPEPPKQF